MTYKIPPNDFDTRGFYHGDVDLVDYDGDITFPPNKDNITCDLIRITGRVHVPQGTRLTTLEGLYAEGSVTSMEDLRVHGPLTALYLRTYSSVQVKNGITTIGAIKVNGFLHSVYGMIKAGSFIDVGGSIKTGYAPKSSYIQAGSYIEAGEGIETRGYIQSGGHISARNSISAKGDIYAGTYIEADTIQTPKKIFSGISSFKEPEIDGTILEGMVV